MIFMDRYEAGLRLAARLHYLGDEDVVVLGLARGGMPVAFEVAKALKAPLDVLVVRKLGVPFQPELAMGAISGDGVRVLNDQIVRAAGITHDELADIEARERAELKRRVELYRGTWGRIPLSGRTVIVVDDGIATSATAQAACETVRLEGAARIVLAVPVAPRNWTADIGRVADDFVSLETPFPFHAVGQVYRDFTAIDDAEVIALLQRSRRFAPTTAAPPIERNGPIDGEIEVMVGSARLTGQLVVPEHAWGLVLFAHGSGSSRHSPRNRYVAGVLNQAGLGTVLIDLLTPDEEADRALVFDVPLLGKRLVAITHWLEANGATTHLPLAYFGASTGAAAALWAAAEPNIDVAAVVSRGGRPDLADTRLPLVQAPTLFIVGGDDELVLRINKEAQRRLGGEAKVFVVAGAGHLFEEPGALRMVAETAREWFARHLAPSKSTTSTGR